MPRARLCRRALSSASVSTPLTFHCVDMASPLSGLQDRAVAKKSVWSTSSCWLQAGPFPGLTPLDHVRSQRIPLHFTQNRQIVFIGMHRKRFESPLPDMAAAFIISMVTANVRRHEPLHPATQVSIFMRPQQQMEMVCHQTKTRQPHRHIFVRLPHQIHKRGGTRTGSRLQSSGRLKNPR